ncbi:FxsA family protein [Nocardioides sp.]|uniref:FxsA family protein n=1 Tax=Nocardioides sp. TaxID=35761 RepID=UPI0027325F2E|nr:FxsA family protein [Nocardioides sp.]MDP3893561.1 FxsA family protein [Nocardioides sp.]
MTSTRRRPWRLFLLAAFVVVPLIEIYLLVQVGQVIGAGWTILLLIGSAAIGTWLIRREGSRAWRALTTALQTGRMPATELADAGLILVGGALMLSPGFVTDAVGVFLILPLTRPVCRRVLAGAVTRRLLQTGAYTGPNAPRPGPGSQGSVVQGEVVDDE